MAASTISACSRSWTGFEPLLEPAGREVIDGRDRLLVPEQALGSQHDQGLAEVAPDLAAEQVEILRGVGRIGHLDVVLGAQCQEPLEPGTRVFGPLAFV